MSNIITKQLEINKASEFCQVVFFKKQKKQNVIFNMSAVQHDLLNLIFYRANEMIIKEKLNLEDDGVTLLNIPLFDLTSVIGKYNNNQYDNIIEKLDDLSDVKVSINSLNKNKTIQELTITRFILSLTVSRHLDNNRKSVKIMMDNKVLTRVNNIQSYFSKMYLTIQLSLKSKYSKLLYELVKDYEGINVISIGLQELLDLLNVAEESMRGWSRFRPHILEKAIKEINEKTDIIISYEPIKDRPNKNERLQVTKVKFVIEKQDKIKLKELGLIEEEQELTGIDYEIKLKALNKYDNLQPFMKSKIKNKDKYVEGIIKKEYNQLLNEIRLDKWLDEVKIEQKIPNGQPQTITIIHSDQYFVIDNDYYLRNINDNKISTLNSIDTRTKLNEMLLDGAKIEMIEMGIISEYSNSSVNF